MTLQQLIYFREVADTRNFTKASKNLNVTQSALSYSIISLERELELPLFIRSCGRKKTAAASNCGRCITG